MLQRGLIKMNLINLRHFNIPFTSKALFHCFYSTSQFVILIELRALKKVIFCLISHSSDLKIRSSNRKQNKRTNIHLYYCMLITVSLRWWRSLHLQLAFYVYFSFSNYNTKYLIFPYFKKIKVKPCRILQLPLMTSFQINAIAHHQQHQ